MINDRCRGNEKSASKHEDVTEALSLGSPWSRTTTSALSTSAALPPTLPRRPTPPCPPDHLRHLPTCASSSIFGSRWIRALRFGPWRRRGRGRKESLRPLALLLGSSSGLESSHSSSRPHPASSMSSSLESVHRVSLRRNACQGRRRTRHPWPSCSTPRLRRRLDRRPALLLRRPLIFLLSSSSSSTVCNPQSRLPPPHPRPRRHAHCHRHPTQQSPTPPPRRRHPPTTASIGQLDRIAMPYTPQHAPLSPHPLHRNPSWLAITPNSLLGRICTTLTSPSLLPSTLSLRLASPTCRQRLGGRVRDLRGPEDRARGTRGRGCRAGCRRRAWRRSGWR